MLGKIAKNNLFDFLLIFLLCLLCIGTTYRYMSMVVEVLLLFVLGLTWLMMNLRCKLDQTQSLKPSISLKQREKQFIYALIFFFLSALLSYILGNGWELKSIKNPSMPSLIDLDLPSKYLLGALLFFLFIKIRLKICKKAVFYAIAFGGIINGCIAIYERYALGISRIHAWNGIAEMADASAVLGIFSCILLIFSTSKKEKIFYLLAVFMACFASILTGTRGAMLGIILTFVFIGGLIFYKKRKLFKIFLAGMLAGFCGFGVDYLIPSGGVQDRIKVAGEDLTLYQEGQVNTSLGMRLEMWKEAITMFQMAPIFGLSTAETSKKMPEILKRSGSQLEKFNHPQNDARGNKHNQILNQAAKRGIVGVLAILLIWITSFRLFLPLKEKTLMSSLLGLSMIFYFIFPNSFSGEPWESNVSFPLMSIFLCFFYKLKQSESENA